jgi:hypothetical protein
MKTYFKRMLLCAFLLFLAFPVALLMAPIRRLRRRLGCKPRIIRGPTPTPLLPETARADRLMGYRSRAVSRSLRGYAYSFLKRHEFDLVLDCPGIPQSFLGMMGFLDLLIRGDIWVTYFDGSYLQDDNSFVLELWLVRLAGIQLIVSGYGRDCTLDDGKKTRFGWVERLLRDYRYPPGHFDRVVRNIALCSRLADFVIAPDYCFKPWFTRVDLVFKFKAIDGDALHPGPPSPNPVPVIVHAPNHRFVKGTDLFLSACERLRTHGCRFELRLIERVDREKALDLYRRADIIADQFLMGNFATLAMEGMALAKPVLCYSQTEELLDPAFNLPVVNTNPENLLEVLYVLIEIPELRSRLGKASRKAIERYQSLRPVGQVWDRIFRHVWHGERLNLKDTIIFAADRPARSTVEDPSRPEFWPPGVRDLLPQIQSLLARFRIDILNRETGLPA